MERIRQDWKQTDLKTLIEGRKYWVNNGHWEFKCISHSPDGVLILVYSSPQKKVTLPYSYFLDVRILPKK